MPSRGSQALAANHREARADCLTDEGGVIKFAGLIGLDFGTGEP